MVLAEWRHFFYLRFWIAFKGQRSQHSFFVMHLNAMAQMLGAPIEMLLLIESALVLII